MHLDEPQYAVFYVYCVSSKQFSNVWLIPFYKGGNWDLPRLNLSNVTHLTIGLESGSKFRLLANAILPHMLSGLQTACVYH